MRHESKFAAWIRSGGKSVFVLPLGPVRAPEVKFSVVPDRLLDSIIDDALATAVARLNGFLPEGVSVDISSVDLTAIRDQLRSSVADRLTETGVAVNANDPVINAILTRYAEALSGLFQRDALRLETYIWRSADDGRVRAAHMLQTTIKYSHGPHHLQEDILAKIGTADAQQSRCLILKTFLTPQFATF